MAGSFQDFLNESHSDFLDPEHEITDEERARKASQLMYEANFNRGGNSGGGNNQNNGNNDDVNVMDSDDDDNESSSGSAASKDDNTNKSSDSVANKANKAIEEKKKARAVAKERERRAREKEGAEALRAPMHSVEKLKARDSKTKSGTHNVSIPQSLVSMARSSFSDLSSIAMSVSAFLYAYRDPAYEKGKGAHCYDDVDLEIKRLADTLKKENIILELRDSNVKILKKLNDLLIREDVDNLMIANILAYSAAPIAMSSRDEPKSFKTFNLTEDSELGIDDLRDNAANRASDLRKKKKNDLNRERNRYL